MSYSDDQTPAPLYGGNQPNPYPTAGQAGSANTPAAKLSLPYQTISDSTHLAIAANKLQYKVGFRPYVGRKYDPTYWRFDILKFTDRYENVYVLKDGVPPSVAIEAIFKKPGEWSFDCAEFVQVILLYTLMHTIGESAFDQLPRKPVGHWLLRQHFSTGLNAIDVKLSWERDENKILKRMPGAMIETKTADQLLKEVPFGTVITFKNYDTVAREPYENENCIKAGDDVFIALAIKKELFVNRKEIETALATAATGLPSVALPKDYIKNNIVIYDILPVPR